MNLLENCFKVIQNIPNAYFYRQKSARIFWEKSIDAKKELLSDIYLYNKENDPNKAYYEKWNARNLRFASRTQMVLGFLDVALNILFLPLTLPLAAAKDFFLLLVKLPAFITISLVKIFYKVSDLVALFMDQKKESDLEAEIYPQVIGKPNEIFVRTSFIENILNTMSFSDVFNYRIKQAKSLSEYAHDIKAQGNSDMFEKSDGDQYLQQYGLYANNKKNYKMNSKVLKLESFFQTVIAYLEIVPNTLFFTANIALALVKDIFFFPVKAAFFAARKVTDFYESFKYIINFISPPKDDPSAENSQDQSNNLSNNQRGGSFRADSPLIMLPRYNTPLKKNPSTQGFTSDNPFSDFYKYEDPVSNQSNQDPVSDQLLSTDNPFWGLPSNGNAKFKSD